MSRPKGKKQLTKQIVTHVHVHVAHAGDRYGQLVHAGVLRPHLVGWLSIALPRLAGQTQVHQVALLYHRHDCHLRLSHRPYGRLVRSSVRRVRTARFALLQNSAHGSHGSPGWHVEVARLGCLRSQAGKFLLLLSPLNDLAASQCNATVMISLPLPPMIKVESPIDTPPIYLATLGAHHHCVYRIFRAHLFVLPCLPGRKRYQRKV